AAYFATIPAKPAAVPPGPVLILSGSCSPVTAGQIDRAVTEGFTGIALDPAAPDTTAARESIIAALRGGRSVVAYTARGSAAASLAPSRELGAALGRLAREAVAATDLRRVVFAGGDTSSYAARALGLHSIEWLAPLAPGAPWCRAHAPGSPVDGLALNFKGGQVGAPDYFTQSVNRP
ncbi:MAG: 3-oxoisoapionate kinase, partial [Verrucomicrobiota bacterium]|nr:3-oxoisoapionate kinase [Verrucomicrobiota bacterium]